MTLHVLHVIPSIALADGGPTHALFAIEHALLDKGVRVTTLTTDHGLADTEIRTPTGVERVYVRKRLNFYKIAPGAIPWLYRYVACFDVVHVHACFSFLSNIAAAIAIHSAVPCVIRPLGTLSTYGTLYRRPALKRWSLRLIEAPLLQRAAAVHFTDSSEHADAEKLGVPMHGVVIPLGIKPPQRTGRAALVEHFPDLQGRRFCLFLSRLDPKKNIEGLLAAFARLAPKFPGIVLVIAGAGDVRYVRILEAKAQALNIADRTIWCGHVSGARKTALLGSAELFVLPSFSENFGIAAAEALHAGLPLVLGEGIAIAAEVERYGAGIAVRPEADSIAAGLERLLGDEHCRKSMRQSGRDLARERYSLDAMGTSLIELYSKLASRKSFRVA